MTTIHRTTVTIAGTRQAIERLLIAVADITTHPSLQQALRSPVWGDGGALLAIDHRQSADLGNRIAEAARRHRLQAEIHSRPLKHAIAINVPNDVNDLRYCDQGIDRLTGRSGAFAYREDTPFEAVTPVYSGPTELYQAMAASGWQHVGRLWDNRFVRLPPPAQPDISPDDAREKRFEEAADLMEHLLQRLDTPVGHATFFDRESAKRWNIHHRGAFGEDISGYIRRQPADESDAKQYSVEVRVFLDRPRAVLWVEKGVPLYLQHRSLLEGEERSVYADTFPELFAEIAIRVNRALHRGHQEEAAARPARESLESLMTFRQDRAASPYGERVRESLGMTK